MEKKKVTFVIMHEDKSEIEKHSKFIFCKDKPPIGKSSLDGSKKLDRKKDLKQANLNKESEVKTEQSSKPSFFKSLISRSRSSSPNRNTKRSQSSLTIKGTEVARRLSEPLKSSFRYSGDKCSGEISDWERR